MSHSICVILIMYVSTGRKPALKAKYNYRIAENFTNFVTCLHGQNFYLVNILYRIDDYTENMATFTTLAKIYSYFCNARVARIGEIFVQQTFRLYGNREMCLICMLCP